MASSSLDVTNVKTPGYHCYLCATNVTWDGTETGRWFIYSNSPIYTPNNVTQVEDFIKKDIMRRNPEHNVKTVVVTNFQFLYKVPEGEKELNTHEAI